MTGLPPSLKPSEPMGPYDLVREVGQGSFSRVYEARDRRSGVRRAIKVFSAACAGDGFVREAGVGLDLHHPNLLAALDVGYLAGGTRFVAYDFVSGGSLRSRLRFGVLPSAEVRHVVVELARALGVLHDASFVHRDLKPENILLETTEPFPRIRLGDLGTSEAVGFSMALGDVGSPAYMAPEQILGACDTRADVYALGVLTYEMIAGHRPFLGEPAEVLRGHLEIPPDLTPIPTAVRDVLTRALAKAPSDRMATPYEFARDFDRALAGDSEDVEVDLEDTAPPSGAVVAHDPASGWRALRWGDEVGLDGSGAPKGHVLLDPTGQAAVCASSLVRFARRDDRTMGIGIGNTVRAWEAPLYGLPPLITICRLAGHAVTVRGGASPELVRLQEDTETILRVGLPLRLCALVIVAGWNGEHVVGVDMQRFHVLVVRAPFASKRPELLRAPSSLVALGTHRGAAWVRDVLGQTFMVEIPAEGPISLVPCASLMSTDQADVPRPGIRRFP